ncbi:MAG: hypothetical protein GXP06_02435 [Alphaproteobacteria bacterium]|nr:hypothetical protein [Alphaproteobacteria bacterium]
MVLYGYAAFGLLALGLALLTMLLGLRAIAITLLPFCSALAALALLCPALLLMLLGLRLAPLCAFRIVTTFLFLGAAAVAGTLALAL